MTRTLPVLFTCLTLALAAAPAVATASPDPAGAAAPTTVAASAPRSRVNLETDPFDYFLHGYGLVVGIRPAALPRWRLALATFALDLPDFLIEMNDANQGFGFRIDHGFGATAGYHFSDASGGFYVGPALGYFINEYTHDEVPDAVTTVHAFNVGVQGGYQWFPIDDVGFYLQPWLNASVPVYQSKDAVVGEREFDSPPVAVNLLVHVGWEL